MKKLNERDATIMKLQSDTEKMQQVMVDHYADDDEKSKGSRYSKWSQEFLEDMKDCVKNKQKNDRVCESQ